MKANYHTHTTRCQHAFGEDREYVEEAIRAGIRILGFSDHCPWIYQNDYVSNIRMMLQETDGYFASLEKLRKEYEKDIEIGIADHDGSRDVHIVRGRQRQQSNR